MYLQYTHQAHLVREGVNIMKKTIIAQKLRDHRGRKTRQEVASTIGISVSALRMYESAERIPRDEVKLALAKYYQTSVQELFFEDQIYKKEQSRISRDDWPSKEVTSP